MTMMHFYDIMDTGIGKTEERKGKERRHNLVAWVMNIE